MYLYCYPNVLILLTTNLLHVHYTCITVNDLMRPILVLHQMVEEIDERFTEERIMKLLEVISTELPDPTDTSEPMDSSTGYSKDDKEDAISAATAEP